MRLGGLPGELVVASAPDGSFEIDDLVPGTSAIEAVEGAGVAGRVSAAGIAPSETTDVGTVRIPEPTLGGALAAAGTALARLRRRDPGRARQSSGSKLRVSAASAREGVKGAGVGAFSDADEASS